MPKNTFDDILKQMQDGAAAQPRLGILAAQIVQLMKDKGLSTEQAIKEFQSEIEKRRPLVEEMRRLAAIENPDDATLKRMEEIIAEQQDWLPPPE